MVSQLEGQKKTQIRKTKDGRAGARDFTNPGLSYGELPDENAKWRLRLRSWHQSRFWLPLWGPKPTEAGCMAPPALLPKPTYNR